MAGRHIHFAPQNPAARARRCSPTRRSSENDAGSSRWRGRCPPDGAHRKPSPGCARGARHARAPPQPCPRRARAGRRSRLDRRNIFAIASPMPIEAPVTTTIFPASSMPALLSLATGEVKTLRYNPLQSAIQSLRAGSSRAPNRRMLGLPFSLCSRSMSCCSPARPAAAHFRAALQRDDRRMPCPTSRFRRGAGARARHGRSGMHGRNRHAS